MKIFLDKNLLSTSIFEFLSTDLSDGLQESIIDQPSFTRCFEIIRKEW